MNSNFDSLLRGIKVDADNWHTLGQLKPNDKFEVDFYGKKPKIYMGQSTGPGLFKKIKNMAKEALTYIPTEEEATRGIVRISFRGMIGGLERTVNRTYFSSVATAADTIKWLDGFIDKTMTDVLVLNEKIQEPMAANLTPQEQEEFLKNKMDLFRLIVTLRNEVSSSQELIENLKTTYAGNQVVQDGLNNLHEKLSGDGGLIKFIKSMELAAVGNLPIELLAQPSSSAASFETLSEKDPLDVITIHDRLQIKNAWKEDLKKMVNLKPLPGEPSDTVVLAPDIFTLDISRAFAYRLNGVTYASVSANNGKKENYKQFYLEMNHLMGEEAAKRVATILNQSMLLVTAPVNVVFCGLSSNNHAQIYDLNVEDGVVTIGASLTGFLRETENPEKPTSDFFYKVKATFSLEELQAADFSEKEDPLPSMRMTEVMDVSSLTAEQRAVFEAQQ